jgi:hypothetical protein
VHLTRTQREGMKPVVLEVDLENILSRGQLGRAVSGIGERDRRAASVHRHQYGRAQA